MGDSPQGGRLAVERTVSEVPGGRLSGGAALPYQRFEGRLSALEIALFDDAADGRWDAHSQLTAALVASGVCDVAAIRCYESQVAGLVAELRRSGRVGGPPRRQAQAVFEFMHRRLLRGGYQTDSTDLRALLDRGRFNCVSASVVFNCLAAEFGLTARGLEMPGHASSRLLLADGDLDVETTCADWFRLLDNPQKQAESASRTVGPQRVSGRGSPEPREVSDVELVATIYYNRGVDLLGQNRFSEAVAANAKALRLDPNSVTARGNLLATLNNWAVAEASAGRFAEAVELLRKGLAIEPSYETFQGNYRHVYRQWIAQLCRAEDFAQALTVLARAVEGRPQEAAFLRARLDVYRLWTRNRVEAGRVEEAGAVVARARAELGDRGEVRELEAFDTRPFAH